jgi:hypothetical protein
MIDPQSNTTITTTIMDSGDGPLFRIVANDQPDKPVKASSPLGVWTFVLRKAKVIRKEDEDKKYVVNGARLYGLTIGLNNGGKKLLQKWLYRFFFNGIN